MIRNEDTYYFGYHRNVREMGAVPALVFDTICGLIRETGIGEIANSTLMDLLGIKSKRTLIDAIDKIIEKGFIEKRNGDGRGNKSIYYITEKGAENIPFMAEKGCRNYQKRVQILHEKGAENAPINTELNKELKERGGNTREAVSPTLSIPPTKNLKEMEDFNLFWELFKGDEHFAHEKENCERVWILMQADWRAKILQQLRDGVRWCNKANPVWYLRDYKGQDVQTGLPYWRQGVAAHTQRIEESKRSGRKIVMMRYEGSLAFCWSSDRETMERAGATYIRDFT